MRVAFWSCMPGIANVSSSMLATALATAAGHKVRCSVLQLHLRNNGLLHALIKPDDNEDIAFFENIGMDALIRLAKGGAATPTDVESAAFSFISRSFNVFVGSKSRNEEVYVNDLVPCMSSVFDLLDQTFAVNFIDVPAGVNVYSQAALELADVIVVCLPQTRWVIDYFFKNYKFDKKKTLFLLGDYDSAQSVNVHNVAYNYSKNMSVKNCVAIAHSVDFANAMNNSKVISYFMQNINCKSTDSNFNFMKSSTECAKKILQFG